MSVVCLVRCFFLLELRRCRCVRGHNGIVVCRFPSRCSGSLRGWKITPVPSSRRQEAKRWQKTRHKEKKLRLQKASIWEFFLTEVMEVDKWNFKAAVSWLLWPMTPEEFFRECETQENARNGALNNTKHHYKVTKLKTNHATRCNRKHVRQPSREWILQNLIGN